MTRRALAWATRWAVVVFILAEFAVLALLLLVARLT
jgi:hypothetical protein